jgi:hypothetical protein
MTIGKRPAWLGLSAPRPACFDAVQWKRWRDAAIDPKLPVPRSLCEDCTPEYQAAMLAANRCQHPEAIFNRDAHGFVQGVLPVEVIAKTRTPS